MTYLLLINRRGLLHRLPEWFPDSRDELLVIATHSSLTGDPDVNRLADRFRHFTVAENGGGPEHDPELIQLCRRHRVERILSTGEHDVLRAARLRAALGLAGQQLPSATAYRDKYVMKTLAAAVGDRHADAAGHRCRRSARLRPRGGSSSGSQAGRRAEESASAACTTSERWTGTPAGGPEVRRASPRLVEAWVEGDVYQVNGLMAEGGVLWSWPSRNLHPDLETLTYGRPGSADAATPAIRSSSRC